MKRMLNKLKTLKNKRNKCQSMQYSIENLNEAIAFVGVDKANWCPITQELWINTHIGDCLVHEGAYIVKKPNVGCYPLSERHFHRLYVTKELQDNDIVLTTIRKQYVKEDLRNGVISVKTTN